MLITCCFQCAKRFLRLAGGIFRAGSRAPSAQGSSELGQKGATGIHLHNGGHSASPRAGILGRVGHWGAVRLPGGALLARHTQAAGRAGTVLGQYPGFGHPCKPCQVLFTLGQALVGN